MYSSKNYDPIGLVGPVTLQFKILFQEIWKLRIGKDNEVPDSIVSKLKAQMEDMRHLNAITVPPYIGIDTPINQEMPKRQLHVFCDASLLAFGAIAYARMPVTTTRK